MDEHVHEWGTRSNTHNIYGDVIEIYCPVCGEVMLWKDAKARLNATERLSAKDAKRALIYARSCYRILEESDTLDNLQSYADILEGKEI